MFDQKIIREGFDTEGEAHQEAYRLGLSGYIVGIKDGKHCIKVMVKMPESVHFTEMPDA